VPATPKSIVHVRPDTFGDLVIFSSALAELISAWPHARHTLVVRPGYEALAPLMPAGLQWKTAKINPFKQSPAQCRSELDQLLAELEQLAPDVVVASTLSRTWLEAAVAAHFPKARRVALGQQEVDPLFATALRLERGVDVGNAFAESVPIDAGARDWENNHRLVSHLLGTPSVCASPVLRIPPSALQAAHAFIGQKGLTAKAWAAVFPAGLANVPIKAWPADRFAEVIVGLQRDGLPVVVMGHVTEKPLLDQVEAEAVARGGTAPHRWLGADGELDQLGAMLSLARIYVGHDTGAMHIAAALGTPVVGIFGGGHWPRFRPVGRQVSAVVQPLPCFGCNWDCHFGSAPCVKTLPVEAVRTATHHLLAAGDAAIDRVAEGHGLPEETHRLIATVTANYRKVQGDRLDRQHKIEELTHLGREKDIEIEALKKSAEDRKTEMESIKAELEAECAFKDTEIAELKQSADDRKTEMESIKAELEAECASKDVEISALKGEADSKDVEIAAIKQIANEREALIITLDGHIKHFQKTQAELQAHIARLDEANTARDAHVARLRTDVAERDRCIAQSTSEAAEQEARLNDLSTKLAHLPPDALQWAQALRDKNVHIRNLETVVAGQKAAIGERDASLANLHNGLVALESAKHYGSLLAEKEAVLQALHTACMEREKVIQQLSIKTAGFGRLVQLGQAARAHIRLKYTTPLNRWLFQKLVEGHWMQIGVLRHYEPRPLKWDRFPKPTLPETRLPLIGVVTPSYGQEKFIESTLLSVLNQSHPRLLYVVQDGGSKDASPQIIARYADRLTHWESVKDKGQADAIRKGFAHIADRLGPDDVMAWLNSDDLIAPHALRFVGEYFAKNPAVDVVYGHRIIIDSADKDVGRWIMPRHEPKSLEWIDYVPQETLFWRKRAWDLAGGIDPSFQFALDWDLLARFTQAGCRIVRLPYFLGCFRVHSEQKTSQAIHTVGATEMARIRQRFHGANQDNHEEINRWARRIRRQGALTARLADFGIRF